MRGNNFFLKKAELVIVEKSTGLLIALNMSWLPMDLHGQVTNRKTQFLRWANVNGSLDTVQNN